MQFDALTKFIPYFTNPNQFFGDEESQKTSPDLVYDYGVISFYEELKKFRFIEDDTEMIDGYVNNLITGSKKIEDYGKCEELEGLIQIFLLFNKDCNKLIQCCKMGIVGRLLIRLKDDDGHSPFVRVYRMYDDHLVCFSKNNDTSDKEV